MWPHNYICVCDPGIIGAGFVKAERRSRAGEVNEMPSERPLKYGLGCYIPCIDQESKEALRGAYFGGNCQ